MDINILFATPIGISKHPELIAPMSAFFEDKELFRISDKGKYGPFWTTMGNYGSRTPAVALDAPIIDTIKAKIVEGATLFLESIGCATDKYDIEVVNLWLNRMKSGATHPTHSHYGYAISGCFYLEVPKNGNVISFYGPLDKIHKKDLDIANYTVFSLGRCDVSVSAGDMVFWESYLRHEVPATEFEGLRLSMAFDVNATYKE